MKPLGLVAAATVLVTAAGWSAPGFALSSVEDSAEYTKTMSATATGGGTQEQATRHRLRDGAVFRDCVQSFCPEMVVIPAGSFVMGSNEYETEMPTHRVKLQRFALGKYEVTQAQWKAVMGDNPSYFAQCGDTCPVEMIRWDDVQVFLRKLRKLTGLRYRLPSEAEWEYAARAGSQGRYWWGETASRRFANYGADVCCEGFVQDADRWLHTAPVGQFPANAFGLHDMQGNVWEWVQDVWHDNYQGAPTNGSAWLRGGDVRMRVFRGGSWLGTARTLRSAYRFADSPVDQGGFSGFRLARSLR